MKFPFLAEALDELRRYRNGEVKLKTITVYPPPLDVMSIRNKTCLPLDEFANRYKFSVNDVSAWEQRLSLPDLEDHLILSSIWQDPERTAADIDRLRAGFKGIEPMRVPA